MLRSSTTSMTPLLIAGLAAGLLGLPRTAAAQHYGTPFYGIPRADFGQAVVDARKAVETYLQQTGVPGFQVSVGVDGGIVWSEGFGLADVEQLVPVTPLTKMQSGSIGKAITATALAHLWEQGKLDWDADVRKYVPAFPDKGKVITIRQLAGHLGGLRHYRSFKDFITYTRYTTYTEGLAEFKDDPLVAEPGTKYSYSSYGFNLLGVVIESITGMEYMAYLRQNVLTPLGMRDTDAMYWNPIIPFRARLYERPSMATRNSYKVGYADPRHKDHHQLINAPYTDISHKTPSGGFVGTADDLVRFTFAHLEPGFLKAETLKLLHTSQKTKDGKETGYGYGWNVGKDSKGRSTLSHGGGPVGATGYLQVYPDQKVTVAIMANITSAQLDEIGEQIADLFIGAGGVRAAN